MENPRVQPDRRKRRAAQSAGLLSLLLLTGCVTVVVPTATPEPLPSPLTVAGHAAVSGKVTNANSDSFALAAGDYAASYTVEPSGCAFTLVLGDEAYTFAVQLTPTTSGDPVPQPSPVTGVAAGTYRWTFSTLCDSWTASMQQIR